MSTSSVRIALAATAAACLATNAMAAAAPPAPRPDTIPLTVLVAFEPIDQTSNSLPRRLLAEASISKAIDGPATVVGNRTLRDGAIAIRSGEYDALWVPSNLAVSASKEAAYEIVGFDGHMTRMVLVGVAGVAKIEEAKRRTLYLPQEDSSASAVGIALLSDHGIRPTDFVSVFTSGSYEIATFSIGHKFTAATVLPESVAKAYLASNPSAGKILETSPPVPGQVLVVRKSLSPVLKKQLAMWAAAQASVPSLTPPTPEAFKYITGLGHYTPEEVAGVQKVTATEVAALTKSGVQLVDVRSAAEYQVKHIPSAQLVSYEERSPRFIGADFRNDGFDLAKLSGFKRVVMYCNGPECWKSFKAVQQAKASGQFEAVFWFRGGMPEWEKSGLPTAGLANNVASVKE
jgi:rhodanese-related sulfurtransferase